MKLSLISSCLAFMAMASGMALAGSVTVTTSGGSQYTSSNGTALHDGSTVRVGTFSLPDATRDQTLAATSDYGQLKQWFKPLGEGIVNAGTVAQASGSGTMLHINSVPNAGDIFGSITGFTTGYLAPGTQLYVWVFDNANPDKATQWGIFTAANWLAPQSLATQPLSTSASVTVIQGSTSAGKLRLLVPKASYSNWAARNFATNTPSSSMLASADPDGDGIDNLAEYAWQLNPTTKDRAPVSVGVDEVNGGLKFTYLSPKNLPDVQVAAECSVDLKSWFPSPATVVGSTLDFDTCQCSPAPGSKQCFWRVRITTVTPQ